MSYINNDISLNDCDLRSYISKYVNNRKSNANENKSNFIDLNDFKNMPDIVNDKELNKCVKQNDAAKDNSSSDGNEKCCEQEVIR